MEVLLSLVLVMRPYGSGTFSQKQDQQSVGPQGDTVWLVQATLVSSPAIMISDE